MKTKLIILTLINLVYTQDVTLTFDCPDEVLAGSEENVIALNLINNETTWGYQTQISIINDSLIQIVEVMSSDRTNHIGLGWNIEHYDSVAVINVLNFDFSGSSYITPGNGPILYIVFHAYDFEGDISIGIDEFLISSYEYVELLEADISDTCTISITEPLPDVYLGFGELDNENQTIEFIMNNSVDVAGIQFSLIGITVGNDIYELGGSAVDNDFWSSTNGHTILISLLGVGGIIPPSNGSLMYFSVESIDSTEACIIDPIMSDDHGDGLTVEIGPCISTSPDCPTAFSNHFEEFNDINGDGSLNISDIVIIVNCIFEAETIYDCLCGDIDEDGETNIIDIVYLVNILLMEN